MLFTLALFVPALLLGYGISELVDDNGDGDATFTGTEESDNIDGKNGDDIINGAGGNDNLEGGSGNDIVNGGEGDDVILGQQNNDALNGDAGDDFVVGGNGSDTVSGGDGDDLVEGNDGSDTLDGGNGDDFLVGGNDADQLSGNAGDDILTGGPVAGFPLSLTELSQLRDGVEVDSVLDGDFGPQDDNVADTLSGGEGNDVLLLSPLDEAAGDEGNDTFALVNEHFDGSAETPALINDYQNTEDAIAVIIENGATPEITVNAEGSDAIILNGETVLARVVGAAATLTASDIDIISGPLNLSA